MVPLGDGFYYVTTSENGCGEGPLGNGRSAPACP